jgi:hypothetical protein
MAGSPLLLRPPDELLARLTDDAEAKGVSVQQLIIELVMAQLMLNEQSSTQPPIFETASPSVTQQVEGAPQAPTGLIARRDQWFTVIE